MVLLTVGLNFLGLTANSYGLSQWARLGLGDDHGEALLAEVAGHHQLLERLRSEGASARDVSPRPGEYPFHLRCRAGGAEVLSRQFGQRWKVCGMLLPPAEYRVSVPLTDAVPCAASR